LETSFGDDRMIVKLVLAHAILATVAIASPALAQSRDHTGSMLPNYYTPTCQQVWGTWGPSQNAASTLSPPNFSAGFLGGERRIGSN
jgi:hypothetical protein